MLKKEKGENDYSFWNLDEDNIRDVMDLNYMGTLLPIQVFTKDMVEKRSGSIINIASVTSILPLTKVMAYGNAKSAILNLTQWLAVHFGESGIRCNAIAPGFVETDMTAALSEDLQKQMLETIPLKRYGQVDDIAQAAVFLAKNTYITGQVLHVDGGMCM